MSDTYTSPFGLPAAGDVEGDLREFATGLEGGQRPFRRPPPPPEMDAAIRDYWRAVQMSEEDPTVVVPDPPVFGPPVEDPTPTMPEPMPPPAIEDERDDLGPRTDVRDAETRDYWRATMMAEAGVPVAPPSGVVELPDDAPGDDRVDRALMERYEAIERDRALDWLASSAGSGWPRSPLEGAPADQPQPSEPAFASPAEFIGDVFRGALETPTQAVGGARDAAQSTLDLGDELIDALEQARQAIQTNVLGMDVEPFDPASTSAPQLPEVREPATKTGGLVRGISQFLTGFAGAGKITGPMKAAGPVVSAATRGAIADFVVFGGHEERLADLIQEFPALQNPVTEFLAADPNDPELVGRFKNAVEGLGVGVAADGLVSGLRAIKAMRVAAAADPEIAARLQTRAIRASGLDDDVPTQMARDLQGMGTVDLPPTVIPNPEDAKLLASLADLGEVRSPTVRPRDESGRFVSRERARTLYADEYRDVIRRSLDRQGLTPLADGEVYVNWARIQTPEDIQHIINDTASATSGAIDEARRGVRTNAETLASAAEVDAWDALMARRTGEPMSAEASVAARQLWVAAADRLKQAAQAAVSEPSLENLYAFRRMAATFHAVQKEVIAARTETARALQSWRIPVGEGLENMTVIQTALNNHGGVEFTREYAAKILAADQAGLRTLSEFVDKSLYAKGRDAIQEYWINSILSGPKTHLVNMISNVSVIGLRLAESAVASRVGRIMGGDDVVEIGEAMANVHGMRSALWDAFRNAGKAFATGETGYGLNKLEGPRTRAISSTAWNLRSDSTLGRAVDLLGAVVNVPGRALGAEDEFFKTIGYRGSIHQQAFRQAMREVREGTLDAGRIKERLYELTLDPPEALRLEGAAAAAYQTFTNEPGRVVKTINKLRSDYPELRFIVPFINTPANIFKFTGERTPLAPLMASYKAAIAKGGAEADLARTKMAMGTALTLLGIDMGLNGHVTGSGPSSTSERANLYRQGWQPYSVRVGDKYIAYNRLDPIGTLFGWGADIGEYLSNIDAMDDMDDGAIEEAMYSVAFSAANNATSKTYLAGISDTILAISDPERYGEGYMTRFAGGFVPTAANEVASFRDPVLRHTTGVVDGLKARLPGAKEHLPPRRDVWGREISYESGLGPVYDALSPLYGSTYDPQPIDLEMQRDGWFIGNMSKAFVIDGERISLRNRPDVYSRYVYLRGQALPSELGEEGADLIALYGDATLLDVLNAVVSGNHPLSAEYRQERFAEDRESFLRKIVGQYQRAAKTVVFAEFPELETTAADRIARRREAEMVE